MELLVRAVARHDLGRLVELLSQLSLGQRREDLSTPIHPAYHSALEAVLGDERQTILVAEWEGRVAGMACLIIVPNLSHVGRPYAMIEDVVVDAGLRGRGIGDALMQRAIEMAKEAGCYKLSLTSNLARTDAHRFYERVGFKATHVGYRLDL
jgi:GNAT superfamily N-acetyltransferase